MQYSSGRNDETIQAEYSVAPNDDVYVRAGSWFGEACLFETDLTRDFTAVAFDESELAVLEAKHYHSIVEKYPRVRARHRHISSSLRSGKVKLEDMACNTSAGDDGPRRRFSNLFSSVRLSKRKVGVTTD